MLYRIRKSITIMVPRTAVLNPGFAPPVSLEPSLLGTGRSEHLPRNVGLLVTRRAQRRTGSPWNRGQAFLVRSIRNGSLSDDCSTAPTPLDVVSP